MVTLARLYSLPNPALFLSDDQWIEGTRLEQLRPFSMLCALLKAFEEMNETKRKRKKAEAEAEAEAGSTKGFGALRWRYGK